MLTEAIAYDLSGGLDIQHHSIKGVSDNKLAKISGDQLMVPLASPDLLLDIRQSLYENDQFGGKIDQRVHYALVNDSVDNSDITLLGLHFGGQFQDNGTIGRIAELVAANADRRFLVYDNLGYGASDAMPKIAAKGLEKTGRFDGYAEIVYNGLASVIKDHDKLDILGESEGGIVGTELVPLAEGARSLIVFDPPSTTRSLLAMFNRFVRLEKAHGQQYLEALAQSGQKMPEWNLSSRQLLAFVVHDIVSGRIAIQKREAQTMSVGAYGNALAEALPYIDERYLFLSPDQSEMNNPFFIRSMISEATRKSDKLPNIVGQIVFNGTHAFAYGNPRALAALETRSLAIKA